MLSDREHPRRIPADADSPHSERVAAVRDWADEADVALSQFFERRDPNDPSVEEVREMVVLLVLWLTLSEGPSVWATAPHVDDQVGTVSKLVDGTVPADVAD